MKTPTEQEIEATILALIAARGPDKSICPSEAARRLAPGDWRPLMPVIRATAGRLVAERRLRATQKGAPVDPVSASGPIRLSEPPRR